jgi:hypothetical protein
VTSSGSESSSVKAGPWTVCDYDGDEENPTWLVVDGAAHFDPLRGQWQIAYTMDDVHWEPADDRVRRICRFDRNSTALDLARSDSLARGARTATVATGPPHD